MNGAIVLIFLIGGIILAAYLTKLVNYYTFGHRMKEKEKNKNKDIILTTETQSHREKKQN